MGEQATEKERKQQKQSNDNTIQVIVKAMQEKKAKDIACMDMTKLEKSVCEHFIIANADSTTQVKAIADHVEETLFDQLHLKRWHREGDENALWIILDYGNIVIHVFQTECRAFYRLEDLWADAEISIIQEN